MILLIVVLTIAAALLGAVLEEGFGFLYGGTTGFLLGMVLWLRSRTARLEKEVCRLKEAGLAPGSSVQAAPAAGPVPPPLTPRPRPVPPTVRPSPGPLSPPPIPPAYGASTGDSAVPVAGEGLAAGAGHADFTFEAETSADALSPPPPPPPPPSPGSVPDGPDWWTEVQGYLTTTHVVLGVGLIILFFGVAFLLKFAIDRGMIPLEARYIGVGLFAMTLLAIGWRLRVRRRGYGLVLQGGAVGILYITVFSAARWHELASLPLGFGLMVSLVVFSVILAVLQDARALANYAVVGGFLAPILTSTGGGQHVILFSYYVLLSIGILAVAFYKTWRELNLLGFGFTLVVGGAWGAKYYRPDLFGSTEPFLIAFFLLYLAVSVLYALRQPPNLKGLVDGTLVFGLPIVAFGLQAALVRNMEYGLAWSSLALSGVYLVLAMLFWRGRPQTLRLLTEIFLSLGVVFGSLTIPLAVDGRWTSAAWAVEGAGLVWVGLRQNRPLARLAGYLLQLGAGLFFLTTIHLPTEGGPVLNRVFVGFGLLTLAALVTNFHMERGRDRLAGWEAPLEILFLAVGWVWWYGGGFREIDRFLAIRYHEAAWLGFFTLSALIQHGLRKGFDWRGLRYPLGVLLAGLAAVVLLQAGRDWGSHPFREWSWLAWPAALGVHYYLLHRHEEDLGRAWAGVVHLAGVGLVVFLAAWEAAWGLDRLIGGGPVWRVAAWGLVPILAARGLMITGDRIPWPVVRFRMEYLSGGVGLLLAAAGWWLIVRGLFHEGKPDPLPYIVLLNPLDLTALFVWETGLAWYRNVRRGALPWPTQTPPLAPAAWTLLVLAFLLVNAFLARAIHFWAPVLWRPDALYRSMAFEAGLSMIWTLWALGMMIAATRYRIRPAWFVGLALLGLVVVKLFFVDLSHTGAILRIVSFMGVGVLMLVTAYFSPLPPKPKGGLAS